MNHDTIEDTLKRDNDGLRFLLVLTLFLDLLHKERKLLFKEIFVIDHHDTKTFDGKTLDLKIFTQKVLRDEALIILIDLLRFNCARLYSLKEVLDHIKLVPKM